MNARTFTTVALAVMAAVSLRSAQAPPPPVSTPKPTPTPAAAPATSPAPAPAVKPAAPSQTTGSADARLGGVPMYPGAVFLQTVDLGSGQSVFVYGTNDPFANAVAFYKGQLGKSTEVSKTPAIQQFDLGSFDSGRMTQRPSVIVKDYTWPDPAGYVHVSGATETRYKTLIQIIPSTK